MPISKEQGFKLGHYPPRQGVKPRTHEGMSPGLKPPFSLGSECPG
jgi:hypothetical protein